MAMVLRQSTADDVLIGPFLDITDGATAETGESPAVKLSKNGQALGAKNDATTPVHDADGYHNCELDATDTNTIGTLVLTVVASANALPVRHEFQVIEQAIYDALYVLNADGFDSTGRVNVGSLESSTAAATSMRRFFRACETGTATAGAVGSITLEAGESALDDFYNGSLIVIQTGTGSQQGRIITAYDGTSKVALVAPDFVTAPASGASYCIMPGLGTASLEAVQRDIQSAIDLKDFADAGYDPAANKVNGVVLTDTLTDYTGNTLQTGDVTTAIDDLANGTDGLTALKTAIDLIPTTAMRGTNSAATASNLAAAQVTLDKIEEASVAVSGVVEADASNSSTQVQTDLAEASDDHYDVMTILFTSGDEAGQSRLITGYTGLTGVVGWNAALVGEPAAGVTFVIIAAGTTADAVWDEILTGSSHNIATSAGRRLRQVEESFVNASGTVVSVSGHTVTLDAGAVATANFYDHARLQITEGTGAGQSRIIVSYSSGRVATLDSDFEVDPTGTSLYEIVAADVHVSVSDADLAGGFVAVYTNTTTITLDAGGAVATTDYYLGQQIVFTHGAGAGQAREITAYTSGRVCTLSPALITALDTTTVWHIQGAIEAQNIDAIKVITDQFVFTKANEVDANTKSINDAEVIGDGNAIPWDGV